VTDPEWQALVWTYDGTPRKGTYIVHILQFAVYSSVFSLHSLLFTCLNYVFSQAIIMPHDVTKI